MYYYCNRATGAAQWVSPRGMDAFWYKFRLDFYATLHRKLYAVGMKHCKNFR